jgi:hypothetical protein
MVGVAGDFVPPSAVLNVPFALHMLALAALPRPSSTHAARADAPVTSTGV